MAFNQDAVVTSSQDGILDSGRIATSMDVKPGWIHVKPPVAKVFPTLRKQDVIAYGIKKETKVKAKKQVTKKQVFPWLCKFNALCREAAGSRSYQRLEDLMNIYIRNVEKDVKNCYKKPIRASKLKTRMNDYLKLFHMLYKEARRPLPPDCSYFARMSDLLAMYLDMEIKASRRGRENPRTVSERMMSVLFILLDNDMDHILNAINKAKFFVKMRFHEICIPIIQRVLRDIPEKLRDQHQYKQYILAFKRWKVLVGSKEERQEINREAASRLIPPPDVCQDSEETRARKITLALMQDTTFNVKDNSEVYLHTSLKLTDPVKSLDDLELNVPLLDHELIGLFDKDDFMTERCTANFMKEMWSQLEEVDVITDSTIEQPVVTADLLEEEFSTKFKKRQEAEEKLRLEKAAKKGPKVKKVPKITAKKPDPSQCRLGCVHSMVPRCSGRVAGGPASTMEARAGCKVSKMEADSQSQKWCQDVIIVSDDDDDEPPVKEKPPEVKEKLETCKQESIQPPILRAVVRPENIEQLTLNEPVPEVSEEKPVSEEVTLIESSDIKQEVEKQSEKNPVEVVVQGGEARVEAVKEVEVVEAAVTSTITTSTETEPAAPLEESKTTTDLLLEEITKVSSEDNGVPQLWMDVDGNLQNQPFEDLFDLNDPNSGFMFYPEVAGDTRNWSFSHDFILGQYDDDMLSQFDCGNTAFPTLFYNDQQDMVFTGADIHSPPLLDMMRDEPGEDQMTTHWEDLSMMVSESYVEKTMSPEREEEASNQMKNDGPQVVFIEKRKGRRGKNKNKVKESSPPSKEIEPVFEKKSKEKPIEDVSKKPKKGQRRKRARFEEEEEEEEEEDPEPEPEPQPKKRKGRQKKNVEPPPPVQPPSPPPPTSGRKPRGAQATSAATKKKTQSRKR